MLLGELETACDSTVESLAGALERMRAECFAALAIPKELLSGLGSNESTSRVQLEHTLAQLRRFQY